MMEHRPRRGSGAWQPRPRNNVAHREGSNVAPTGAADHRDNQGTGPARQGEPHARRQTGHSEQPAASSLRADAMTWQQQDILDGRGPSSGPPQPEQRQQPRQRLRQPGSRQSQGHSTADEVGPAVAGAAGGAGQQKPRQQSNHQQLALPQQGHQGAVDTVNGAREPAPPTHPRQRRRPQQPNGQGPAFEGLTWQQQEQQQQEQQQMLAGGHPQHAAHDRGRQAPGGLHSQGGNLQGPRRPPGRRHQAPQQWQPRGPHQPPGQGQQLQPHQRQQRPSDSQEPQQVGEEREHKQRQDRGAKREGGEQMANGEHSGLESHSRPPGLPTQARLRGEPRRRQHAAQHAEQQQRQQQAGGSGVSASEGGADTGVSEAEEAPQHVAGEAKGAAVEAPQCLVCCTPMQEVAIGACNHRQVCGMCTLRLRLLYSRKDCPLCKTELKEVVIAPWRGEGPPDFDFYQTHPDYVARAARWDRGILADRWQPRGRLSSRLMHELQRRTALACVVCDRAAARPFAKWEQLARHVQEAHDQRLCGLCMEGGHRFALEMEPYPGFEALQQHLDEAHPRCDFCSRRFYDDDGLWKHMQQAHYSCHVCPPPAGTFAYFNTARDLVQHMRADHHMCEEPECADCFVAFPSAEELRRHHLERHSARMPRWDPSRARPLQLDIHFASAPLGTVRQRARAERRAATQQAQQDAGGASQDVRQLDVAGTAARPEYAREAEGGFRIVDDDLGMTNESAGDRGPAERGGGNPHFEPLAGGSWAGRGGRGVSPGAASGGEEFPSLATAAAVAAAAVGAGEREGGGGNGGAALAVTAGRRPPPLVKRTVRCPCGRRVTHHVVEEGQEVAPLQCDGICELEGRRHRLADAFGVDHPERHVAYFDRHRTPTYSGQLIAYAQQHPKAVEGLEKAFAAFLADTASRRHSLAPAPREARGAAHELAAQYGFASQSYGQEPQRYVELFKTDSAGMPAKLLSRVAPGVPPEEVAAMVREGSGHPMRLTDVALSVDVHHYLRRWEGGYKLEWEGGDAAVVRFERKGDLEEALATLGGGIRGLFRVDRAWRPRAGLTAGAAGPSGSRGTLSAGGWGAAAGTARDSGADGGSWTVVAASAPRPPQHAQQVDAEAAGKSQQGAGGLRSGWAVIGKKKGPAQPTPAAAGGGAAAGAGGVGIGGLQGDGEHSTSAPNLGNASQLGLADDAWEA